MSSSGSWCGAGGRPADIIDLDKFMRGGVRHSRHVPSVQNLCNRLVLDNGGPSLKINESSSRGSSFVGRARIKHQKRYSHDSGMSDGSHTRRRFRHRRRANTQDSPEHRGTRESTDSLRAFRAVCERILLDQQKQIARVAQLCERLAEKHIRERGEAPDAVETSDLSSSSKSTRDLGRQDKHRTQECKTYKIIMNKLDELNRLFAAGKHPPPRPKPAPHPRRTPSSGTITVSDKIVATEPEAKMLSRLNTSIINPNNVNEKRTLIDRAVGSVTGSQHGSVRDSQGRSARIVMNAVTKAYALDISPRRANGNRERPNVITESVIKDESSHSSKCDPTCGFDLDDPLHLYSQAKRLEALHARTRRRSLSADNRQLIQEHESVRTRTERRTRHTSLCSLCRCYWRSFREFFTGQFCPDYK